MNINLIKELERQGDYDIRFIQKIDENHELYRLKNKAGVDFSIISEGDRDFFSCITEHEPDMIACFNETQNRG